MAAGRAAIFIEQLHAVMGCATEAGELVDAYKKTVFYGKPLDTVNVKEEIGDILWYLAILCREHGWSFEEIMSENTDKLRLRYPEQFTTQDAIERKDKENEN